MSYAESTSVPFERSIAEIITMIKRAGAQQIGQMDDEAFYAIQFRCAVNAENQRLSVAQPTLTPHAFLRRPGRPLSNLFRPLLANQEQTNG